MLIPQFFGVNAEKSMKRFILFSLNNENGIGYNMAVYNTGGGICYYQVKYTWFVIMLFKTDMELCKGRSREWETLL